MPSKYQIISELASQTARDITSKAERYTDFLVTAANNYKYSFKEQLLIHAQKPDATACAEIETWNRLGRWVNKGTRGIALLVDRDTPYKLRHVFDYSDTNSRAGRVVTLWQMRPQYEEPVKESLQDSFGEVELTADFPHFIMEIAKNAVEDNFSDYLSNLQSVKGDSFLEELDDLNLEVWLKDTLRSSVAYMALVRAGYQPSLYFTRDDFSHIYDFNTIPVISVLGAATSDISEMVIREIAETIKGLEKEEKQSNRTFARDRSSEYHESRNNKTGEQLDHSGKCSSDSHTGSTKLGCSEQSEDKSRIQKDIQSKCQHIHRHAGSYPANASKNSQINLCHTPADIGDTHNADIRRTYGQKFRVIGEQFHHHLRHGKRNQSHKNRDDHGKTKSDSLDDLNGFVISLSIILGTKQGCSRTKTVIYHKQDIGIICCQGNCGDG